MYQPCVGDPGLQELEILQVCHSLKMYEPRVADSDESHEPELLQAGQPFKVHQPGVGERS